MLNFVFSAISMIAALIVLSAAGEAHSTSGTITLWVLATAFFGGGLVLGKRGLVARKKKAEARSSAG